MWDMHFPGKFTRGREKSTRSERERAGDPTETREKNFHRRRREKREKRSQGCDQRFGRNTGVNQRRKKKC